MNFGCVSFSIESILIGCRKAMGKDVRIMLHELIDEHNISMRELSRIADVRSEALNELANQKRQKIQFDHIKKIAEALDIEDIRKIITLIEVDDEKDPE